MRTRPPRIAVIAVHGVADQQPGDSSRAVAGLLLQLDTNGKVIRDVGQPAPTRDALYPRFAAETVHIPVQPLAVPPRTEPGRASALHVFEEREPDECAAAALRRTNVEPDPGRVGYAFFTRQLAGYKPGTRDPSYVTTVLQGARTPGAGDAGPRVAVDVYELYWADLSRLGRGMAAFFTGLYGAVLHLSALGRQAIDAAIQDESCGVAWRSYRWFHAWTIRLLVLFVPAINLSILIASVALIPTAYATNHHIDVSGRVELLACLIGGALGAIGISHVLGHRVPSTPERWAVALIGSVALCAAGATLVVRGLLAWTAAEPSTGLLIESWLVGGAVMVGLMWGYERVRPGAVVVGTSVYVAMFVLLVGSLVFLAGHPPSSGSAQQVATMWSIQGVFLLHTVTWLTLFTCALASYALGKWLVHADRRAFRREGNDEDANPAGVALRARAARTHAVTRTARLSLAISLIAVLIPLQIGWSGILGFVATRLEPFHSVPPARSMRVEPLPVEKETARKVLAFLVPDSRAMSCWVRDPKRLATPDDVSANDTCRGPDTPALFARQYLTSLVLISVHSAFPVTLGLFVVALLLLAAAAIPSVKFERRASITSTNGTASRAGRLLSRGLDAASIATNLMWFGAFPLLFCSWIWDEIARVWGGEPSWLAAIHHALLGVTLASVQPRGALVAGTVVFLLATIARLGGSALDVLLDVVNYLRIFPRDDTPAARIAERYASLLRHVAAFRRDGAGYDAVVIVAHSLGSLITADVLRALRRQANAQDGDLRLAALGFGPDGERAASIPIHLFTMGNPLRQSLNRWFPYRYRWVREEPDNGMLPLNAQAAEPPSRARPPACPAVVDLGVSHWSNAYRSGDYVGRSLWLTEWYARNEGGDAAGSWPEALQPYESPSRDRWEACIGCGAHTHYWDVSASDVAERLDELIQTGAEAARLVGVVTPGSTAAESI